MSDYSGKFVLRIPPQLHGQLKKLSQQKGVSLNQTCSDLIQKGLHFQRENLLPSDRLEKIHNKLTHKYRDDYLGLVLFGSIVKQNMFEFSDIDLLVVLHTQTKLTRSHYRYWDQNIDDEETPIINPHFVHLPRENKSLGSLWLEVAHSHILFWQRTPQVSKTLNRIKNLILDGHVRRKSTHGQPYWVWENSYA